MGSDIYALRKIFLQEAHERGHTASDCSGTEGELYYIIYAE